MKEKEKCDKPQNLQLTHNVCIHFLFQINHIMPNTLSFTLNLKKKEKKKPTHFAQENNTSHLLVLLLSVSKWLSLINIISIGFGHCERTEDF